MKAQFSNDLVLQFCSSRFAVYLLIIIVKIPTILVYYFWVQYNNIGYYYWVNAVIFNEISNTKICKAVGLTLDNLCIK